MAVGPFGREGLLRRLLLLLDVGPELLRFVVLALPRARQLRAAAAVLLLRLGLLEERRELPFQLLHHRGAQVADRVVRRLLLVVPRGVRVAAPLTRALGGRHVEGDVVDLDLSLAVPPPALPDGHGRDSLRGDRPGPSERAVRDRERQPTVAGEVDLPLEVVVPDLDADGLPSLAAEPQAEPLRLVELRRELGRHLAARLDGMVVQEAVLVVGEDDRAGRVVPVLGDRDAPRQTAPGPSALRGGEPRRSRVGDGVPVRDGVEDDGPLGEEVRHALLERLLAEVLHRDAVPGHLLDIGLLHAHFADGDAHHDGVGGVVLDDPSDGLAVLGHDGVG